MTGTLGQRESLTRTILSMESTVAKQNALQHVLNGLRVMYARDTVIAALSSNNKLDAPVPGITAWLSLMSVPPAPTCLKKCVLDLVCMLPTMSHCTGSQTSKKPVNKVYVSSVTIKGLVYCVAIILWVIKVSFYNS